MAVCSTVRTREITEWHRLDAEFWRPEYRRAHHLVSKCKNVHRLEEVAKRMRKGIFYILAEEYVDDGVPFLRVTNVKSILLDTNDLVYISEQRNRRDNKTCFKKGDVVLNKTGDIGAAVIGLASCNISQDLIGVEIAAKDRFNPYYVATFLNTKYGQLQLQRWFQGQVQMHLALADARKILVPFPGHHEQRAVEEIILSAEDEVKKSESLYLQAEREVLHEMGWKKPHRSQPNWYTVRLARMEEVHRLDAEHFQPKYDSLIAHLEETGEAKPLGEIATYVKRGLQPDYAEDGEISVVNSQHLGRFLLNVEATERTERRFWDANKRARLQKNDVLLYSTGAYVGRTNVWLEERKGIASNHVTIIRPARFCDPLYLAVFLNAAPGVLQTEKWASGSGQREIYSEDIQRFLIYLPSEKFQQKVADLVHQSYRARQKAKAFLDEAKAKVGSFIGGK